jgi:hypothetical protein
VVEAEEVEAARAQIERSRADLAATADDLHDRLSPRQAAGRQVAKASSRARQMVGTTKRVVIGVPLGQVQNIAARVGDSAGGLGETTATGLGQAPALLKGSAEGNPMAAGVVAFGLGLLAASVFPASSTERQAASSIGGQLAPVREHLHEAANEIGGAVRESAQEAAQQVRGMASEATEELAQQSRSAAAQVADEGRSAAQDVRQQS